MPSERIYSDGQTEERVQIVELMDLGKHHAAAQIGTGRVHLAIILIGMPVGQILADRGAASKEVAEHSALDCFCEFAQTWMETQLITDHGNALVLDRGANKFVRAVHGVG